MAVWTARHDNGWSALVVENPNGSFAAWAAAGDEGSGVYSILADAEQGKAAAGALLRRETGHARCSDACTGWKLRTYAVFDRGPGVGRAAKRSVVSERTHQPATRRIA
jgi:hypothetical protein